MNRRTIARMARPPAPPHWPSVSPRVTALPLGLTASAQATPAKAPSKAAAAAPRTVTGSPSGGSVTRIADFYGAYIDAQSGPRDGGKLVAELRKYSIPSRLPEEAGRLGGQEPRGWRPARPERPLALDGHQQRHRRPHGGRHHADLGLGGTTTSWSWTWTRDHRIINIGTKGIGGK